jgi:hypothetical protein
MTRRYASFGGCILAMIVLWGWVLPMLGETDAVQQRNRWLEAKGIDPAAMYYTDLPLMEELLQRPPDED